MYPLLSFIGLLTFTGMAYAMSADRKRVKLSFVASALGLQMVLALLVLGIPSLGFTGPLHFIFEGANVAILKILNFSNEGARFLFGSLLDVDKHGFLVAFTVLPTIVFMSALMSVLYYLGIMQWVVRFFAVLMHKTLKISGAESLASAANIFVGQTEAPLVIKPFLKEMTRSELFCLMVGGMANVAGGVLAAYVGLLKDLIPGIGGHLLTASVISAPAAILIAKLMIPETEHPKTLGSVPQDIDQPHVNVFDAATNGTTEGVVLAVNVAGQLLVFISLMAMLDYICISAGEMVNFSDWAPSLSKQPAQFSLSWIMSWVFSPVAVLMGVPFEDVGSVAVLLGKKTTLNEFVAYIDLAQIGPQLQQRSMIIASYALCGFANFSSIAIQIGGIGSLAPERKQDLARLGLRCLIGGSLASFMTAAIAGLLI